MFAQVLSGGRISLAVGFAAMLLSLLFGTLIGLLAGYFHALDGALMRLTDLFLALPLLPLLLVIIMLFRDTLRNAFGPETGIFLLVVFVIGIPLFFFFRIKTLNRLENGINQLERPENVLRYGALFNSYEHRWASWEAWLCM